MKRAAIILLGLILLSAGRVWADVPAGYVQYLDVTAKIDGSDNFELTGNLWRWQHFNWTIPEQHGGITETIVNGQAFLSTWPEGTSYGSYSAYNMVSGLQSIEQALDLSQPLYFDVVSARGVLTLAQSPNAGNNYKTLVYFNDDPQGSDSIYSFKIWGAPSSAVVTPEPASMVLFGLGGAAMGLRRLRRNS